MNRQQLLSRLGSRAEILYSTGVMSTWDRGWWRIWRVLRGGFERCDGVTLDRTPSWLVRVPSMRRLDECIVRMSVARWRRWLDAQGRASLVAYLFHPKFEPLIDALAPDFVVYHAYDMLSRTPGWDQWTEAQEARVLTRADLVVASSDAIAAELQPRARVRVQVIGNGVDFGAFADAGGGEEPADLACVPRPRIGYVGRINRKFDMDLLVALARAHPEWHFVLVGPLVEMAPEHQSSLAVARSLANVHFLGNKPREALPRYTAGLDVGLLCYRTMGAWTEGIYPLKLHEYLACGLPVVSADFPVARSFPTVVWIASSPEEWQDRIGAALAGQGPGDRGERIATARANSWAHRAETLWEQIQAMRAGHGHRLT